MARNAPENDIDEAELRVSEPKTRAVGVPGVLHAMQASIEQMGVVRSAQTLLKVNQKDGFDCMGCAWPEGDSRHTAEFCENGAKAVAEEAGGSLGKSRVKTSPARVTVRGPLAESKTIFSTPGSTCCAMT